MHTTLLLLRISTVELISEGPGLGTVEDVENTLVHFGLIWF